MARSPGITYNQLDAASGEWLMKFITSRNTQAAAAPDRFLLSWIKTQSALITLLAADDKKICATYGLTGRLNTGQSSAAVKALADDVQVRILEAIRTGIDHPSDRPRDQYQADQSAVFAVMMASGVSRKTLETTFLKPDPPAEVACKGVVALYEAPTRMPPAQAARVVSDMISASK